MFNFHSIFIHSTRARDDGPFFFENQKDALIWLQSCGTRFDYAKIMYKRVIDDFHSERVFTMFTDIDALMDELSE